jgi:hypothetical protein
MESALDAILFGIIAGAVGGISLGIYIYRKDKKKEEGK